MIQIYNEDCLEGMARIADDSVDMILTDPPFGITALPYDKQLDLAEMWRQFKRILKPCSAAVLFASGKFTHQLIASNFEQFKYKWIWIKNAPSFFAHAKNRPMSKYEEICVFSDGKINHVGFTKKRMKYNPQGLMPTPPLYECRTSWTVRSFDHNVDRRKKNFTYKIRQITRLTYWYLKCRARQRNSTRIRSRRTCWNI